MPAAIGTAPFYIVGVGGSAQDAFDAARRSSQRRFGRCGVAEKARYKIIPCPDGDDFGSDAAARAYAEALVATQDYRITDRWGPAGALRLPSPTTTRGSLDSRWLFFGFAGA